MEILKICLFALSCGIAVFLIRDYNKNVAVLLGVVGGVCLLLCVLSEFTDLYLSIEKLVIKTGLEFGQVNVVFKIVAISYIAQLTMDILDEMGVKSLGNKIALITKLIILSLCFPIINQLINAVYEVL